MMGKRVMAEPVFSTVQIDDHLPANHLLRAVDALLDTSFVRRIMAPHYSLIGRPSIDPELMIRMLLLGYLGGIRSERKLCAGMHLNLAHRWFCRLGVDDVVPNHSTFSKNRHRRFRDGHVFRAVFEQVVRCCMEAGLVPGENAAVDGSQVDADASRHKRLPGDRMPEAWMTDRKAQAHPVREHLEALGAAVPPGPDEPRYEAPKYLSPTDPAAAWSIKHGVGVFAYETNLLVDTAHGIIVDVEATPARLSQEIVAAKACWRGRQGRSGSRPPASARTRATAQDRSWPGCWPAAWTRMSRCWTARRKRTACSHARASPTSKPRTSGAARPGTYSAQRRWTAEQV